MQLQAAVRRAFRSAWVLVSNVSRARHQVSALSAFRHRTRLHDCIAATLAVSAPPILLLHCVQACIAAIEPPLWHATVRVTRSSQSVVNLNLAAAVSAAANLPPQIDCLTLSSTRSIVTLRLPLPNNPSPPRHPPTDPPPFAPDILS